MEMNNPTYNFGCATYTFNLNCEDDYEAKRLGGEAALRLLAAHNIQADPKMGIGTETGDGCIEIEIKVMFL